MTKKNSASESQDYLLLEKSFKECESLEDLFHEMSGVSQLLNDNFERIRSAFDRSEFLVNRAFGKTELTPTIINPEQGSLVDVVELDYTTTSCENSVCGPAAYFYDLLRISLAYVRVENPKYKIYYRRPDLLHIPLDTKHTQKTWPSVAIANYVMARHLLSLLNIELDGEQFDKKLFPINKARYTKLMVAYQKKALAVINDSKDFFNDCYHHFRPKFDKDHEWASILLQQLQVKPLAFQQEVQDMCAVINGQSSQEDRHADVKVQSSSSVDIKSVLNLSPHEQQLLEKGNEYKNAYILQLQDSKVFCRETHIPHKLLGALVNLDDSKKTPEYRLLIAFLDRQEDCVSYLNGGAEKKPYMSLSLDRTSGEGKIEHLSEDRLKRLGVWWILHAKTGWQFVELALIFCVLQIDGNYLTKAQLNQLALLRQLQLATSLPVRDCVKCFFTPEQSEKFIAAGLKSSFSSKDKEIVLTNVLKKLFPLPPKSEAAEMGKAAEVGKVEESDKRQWYCLSHLTGLSLHDLSLLMVLKIPLHDSTTQLQFLIRLGTALRVLGLDVSKLLPLLSVYHQLKKESPLTGALLDLYNAYHYYRTSDQSLSESNKNSDSNESTSDISTLLALREQLAWFKTQGVNFKNLDDILSTELSIGFADPTLNTEWRSLQSSWPEQSQLRGNSNDKSSKQQKKQILRLTKLANRMKVDVQVIKMLTKDYNRDIDNKDALFSLFKLVKLTQILAVKTSTNLKKTSDILPELSLFGELEFFAELVETHASDHSCIVQEFLNYRTIKAYFKEKAETVMALSLCLFRNKNNKVLDEEIKQQEELDNQFRNKLAHKLNWPHHLLEAVLAKNTPLIKDMLVNYTQLLEKAVLAKDIQLLEDVLVHYSQLLNVMFAKNTPPQEEAVLAKDTPLHEDVVLANNTQLLENVLSGSMQLREALLPKNDQLSNQSELVRALKCAETLMKVNKLYERLGRDAEFLISYLHKLDAEYKLADFVDVLEHQLATSNPSAYQAAQRQFHERQRDVLVAAVIYALAKDDQNLKDDNTKPLGIHTPSQLSQYLLIDVETSGADDVSPIIQGHLSLQGYLRRCRMGLEQQEGALVINKIPESWWSWLMSYRVWEANRKIFLYPENYLEPDLRVQQSPEFRQLSTELKKYHLQKESVEQACTRYITSVSQLSTIEIISVCYDHNGDINSSEGRKHFMIGVDFATEPCSYFLRSVVETLGTNNNTTLKDWTYWEKIDLPIIPNTYPTDCNLGPLFLGKYIHPIATSYAFDRLYFFWVEMSVQENLDAETQKRTRLSEVQENLSSSIIKTVEEAIKSEKVVEEQKFTTHGNLSLLYEKKVFNTRYNIFYSYKMLDGQWTPKKSLKGGTLVSLDPMVNADPKVCHFNCFPYDNNKLVVLFDIELSKSNGSKATVYMHLDSFGKISDLDGKIDRNNLSDVDEVNSIFKKYVLGKTADQINDDAKHKVDKATNFYKDIQSKCAKGKLIDFVNVPQSALSSFAYDDFYGSYYWELCYFVPLLIANTYRACGQYEQALPWYTAVFNPNLSQSGSAQNNTHFGTASLFRFAPLMDTQDNVTRQLTQADLIRIYHEQIADAHSLAALRILPYKKYAVMQYLQNLLVWADYLFSRNSRESSNEAIQWYLTAYDLLGDEPRVLHSARYERPSRYAIDILLYNLTPAAQAIMVADDKSQIYPYNYIETSYFHVPENREFMRYWTQVNDRLFKIRHSLNILGVRHSPALFAPEIDLHQLVRVAAQQGGESIQDMLDDIISVYRPFHRFGVLIQYAKEFTQQVIAVGEALLGALERQDNQKLLDLNDQFENQMVSQICMLRNKQIDEAKQQKLLITKQKDVIEERLKTYTTWVDEDNKDWSLLESDADVWVDPTRGVLSGGTQIHRILSNASHIPSMDSQLVDITSQLMQQDAGYALQYAEWQPQKEELELEKDILDEHAKAAELRVDIATLELEQFNQTVAHQREVHEYYLNKLTNIDLYRWLAEKLADLYRQAYDLAVKAAKNADKAHRYELEGSVCISRNWNSFWVGSRQGLLAGRQLMQQLNELEQEHLDQISRPKSTT